MVFSRLFLLFSLPLVLSAYWRVIRTLAPAFPIERFGCIIPQQNLCDAFSPLSL
jgi:hypothetical protein